MHGSTNGTAAIESQESTSGQAWVIDARARGGSRNAVFAKTVWQTFRESKELRETITIPHSLGWGVVRSEPSESRET